ncbi:unnamed protein product [Prorocentrum cordatum]|uniref:Calmodulin n=1 Tax=Prorocentrum cordatum TaxID=2364126 RepID=A0ABN9UEP7_9DINO|nr:unnamed protein product [Polarella glacialis]
MFSANYFFHYCRSAGAGSRRRLSDAKVGKTTARNFFSHDFGGQGLLRCFWAPLAFGAAKRPRSRHMSTGPPRMERISSESPTRIGAPWSPRRSTPRQQRAHSEDTRRPPSPTASSVFSPRVPSQRGAFSPTTRSVVGRDGETPADAFRARLLERHASLTVAWREELDVRRDGWISFEQLCQFCRAVKFHGSISGLWQTLDPGGEGKVRLEDLDPEGAQLLGKFSCLLAACFGGLSGAASRGLGLAGGKRLRCAELCRVLADEGLAERPEACTLFRLLAGWGPGGRTLGAWELESGWRPCPTTCPARPARAAPRQGPWPSRAAPPLRRRPSPRSAGWRRGRARRPGVCGAAPAGGARGPVHRYPGAGGPLHRHSCAEGRQWRAAGAGERPRAACEARPGDPAAAGEARGALPRGADRVGGAPQARWV